MLTRTTVAIPIKSVPSRINTCTIVATICISTVVLTSSIGTGTLIDIYIDFKTVTGDYMDEYAYTK